MTSKPNIALTQEKLDKYFSVTAEALALAKDKFTKESPEKAAQAADFFDMAQRYYDDALHFKNVKNDWILAFAALNYAHGWLDAGARAKLFLVTNSRLFTVDGPYE